jgi:hypothetical protein
LSLSLVLAAFRSGYGARKLCGQLDSSLQKDFYHGNEDIGCDIGNLNNSLSKT